MFRVRLDDGREVKVTFSHERFACARVDLCMGIVTAETTCLLVGIGPRHFTEGMARCSIWDQFCKATGRKIAFERALKAAGLHREHRKLMWEAFWQREKRR